MFDVGFSEVVVCFLVALIVLGPQKLPEVARTLGRWTGRARSYMRNLSAELERETGGASSSLQREIGDAARSLREGAEAVKGDFRKMADAATSPAQKTSSPGDEKDPGNKP